MNDTTNEYKKTTMMLKILAVILLVSGIFSNQAALIAIACGYYVASTNPWRYRIMIHVGLILHACQFLRAIFCMMTDASCLSYIDLLISPAIFGVLVLYYPSPYPASSNLLGWIVPTGLIVAVIDTFPTLFKLMSKNSIIGTVEGLYINSDAFSIVQEENFLGFTPTGDIIEAAQQAGVQRGKTLLDIGCGIGGPACMLAAEFGLNVTGVDLLAWNVERASAYAASRGLKNSCRFVQSNALSLPFKDNTFDYVFGMDAWCHIPNRDQLLKECYRVLKEDGTILFHDWLMDQGDSEGFRFVYAFPPLETIDTYTQKLREAGFDIDCAYSRREAFKTHVSGLRATLHTNKRRMIDTCGRELYDNWDVISLYTLKMIEKKKLDSGCFIAQKKQ